MILLIFQINPHVRLCSVGSLSICLWSYYCFFLLVACQWNCTVPSIPPPPRARTVTTDCGTFSSPSSFFFVTNLITAALSSLPWCPGPSFAVLHFCLDDIFVELPQETPWTSSKMSVTLFVLICGLRWREVVQDRCPVVPDPPPICVTLRCTL